MSSSLLEIVELENGDIVLQRADEEGEALVNIRFSAEAKDYMANATMDIAKLMIQAGIQAAAHMDLVDAPEVELDKDSEASAVNHTLH